MPTTQADAGMKILARTQRITPEEWITLLEARRALIKPHLDKFTLSELGDLECMRRELSFTHRLHNDGPEVLGDKNLSLTTQGIFRVQPWSAIWNVPNSGFRPGPGGVGCSDGTKLIWGLARSGQWVLATVDFVGEAGYKDRGYERARSVSIVYATIKTIIEQTKEKPRNIWRELGVEIQRFTEHRRQLYAATSRLARQIEVEEIMLSLVPSKEK